MAKGKKAQVSPEEKAHLAPAAPKPVPEGSPAVQTVGQVKLAKRSREADKVHVWPYLVRAEFLCALCIMILLTVWSVVVDAPLEQPANPALTPNPSKAPWYFLGLQEMLVYFDPWIAGVVLPTLIIVGLMLIPYIDINPKGSGYYTFSERKVAVSIFLFGFGFLWIVLIINGVFLRGPGWNFFLPGQEWDPHKIVALTNVDLPFKLFGFKSEPAANVQTFLTSPAFHAGAFFVSGYYFLGVLWYLLRLKTGGYENVGVTRYAIKAFLFLTMMALVIKLFLRIAFNIKYVWVTPWFNI
ncbi:MAG: cytochrome C [Nitrospinota bacterium]